MKPDNDLRFLKDCRNEDLKVLCDILTHDGNGDLRLTEQLTNTDDYLLYYPLQLGMMADTIAGELRKYGSNTVKTFVSQGEPDTYEVILQRVCRKMNVYTEEQASVPEVERSLLTTVCEQTTRKLTEGELRDLADDLGIQHKRVSRQVLVGVLMTAIRSNVRIFARLSYYVATRVATMLLGRSIMSLGIGNIGRMLGIASGPAGWAALTAWTISDIASPAYRVCVPAVIQVAAMRMSQTNQ